jgi:hypothetical protein
VKPHDPFRADANQLNHRSGTKWLKAQGAVTEIRYSIPSGRLSLKVMRNHQQAPEANGFTPVISCADKEWFTGGRQDSYLLGQRRNARACPRIKTETTSGC